MLSVRFARPFSTGGSRPTAGRRPALRGRPLVGADATSTLAFPRVGLREAPRVGELYLADISVPPSVCVAIGAGPSPDFNYGSVVRVHDPREGTTP